MKPDRATELAEAWLAKPYPETLAPLLRAYAAEVAAPGPAPSSDSATSSGTAGRREGYGRRSERRAAKAGVTVRHDDAPGEEPKRIRHEAGRQKREATARDGRIRKGEKA